MNGERILLGDIARKLGGAVVGDSAAEVTRPASPTGARAGDICTVWEVRDFEKIRAGVHVLASPDAFASRPGLTGISVDDPRAAFPALLSLFQPVRKGRGVHPSAVISPLAALSPDAWIGPLCVVEDGAVIGEGVRLRANVFVGEGCVLGAGTVVEPGAVLLEKVRTGQNCLIHGGAVLGSDGFGILPAGEVSGPVKIPQLGGVVLGDEVEIGACTTVDRGTLDDTVVGDFTKVDDHVHIAHNTVIGKNCIVVAMTGIAGSAVLEDNVIMAARSGVKDHTRIGRGATVAANAGAIKDVPPGTWCPGFPPGTTGRTSVSRQPSSAFRSCSSGSGSSSRRCSLRTKSCRTGNREGKDTDGIPPVDRGDCFFRKGAPHGGRLPRDPVSGRSGGGCDGGPGVWFVPS